MNQNKKEALNQSTSATSQTSKSLVQLAKESFKLGKLLGVHVIQNEKAATARMTKTLKMRKKGGQTTLDPTQS